MLALYVCLALLLGCVNVFSKTVNFQAAQHLGTANGTLINYVVASCLSVVLLLLLEPGRLRPAGLQGMPAWLLLGGVFGVIALVINVYSLSKVNLFQSTVLVLMGQLAGSALLDAILFYNMSALKLLGVFLVAVGIVWDKKLSAQTASGREE